MDKLIDKLNKEFDDYKGEILELQSTEIFDRSYETAIKTELVCLIEGWEENSGTLSKELLDELLRCENALEFLYYEYIKDDTSNIMYELIQFLDKLEYKIKSI